MVIRGHETELFAVANMAVLRKKRVNGDWIAASTNESWELFWCELTELHPDDGTVELADADEPIEIQEDDLGEFIELRQEHEGAFTATDTHRTRFRPFYDRSVGDPPWKGDS